MTGGGATAISSTRDGQLSLQNIKSHVCGTIFLATLLKFQFGQLLPSFVFLADNAHCGG
jgi:hypothetical protein